MAFVRAYNFKQIVAIHHCDRYSYVKFYYPCQLYLLITKIWSRHNFMARDTSAFLGFDIDKLIVILLVAKGFKDWTYD